VWKAQYTELPGGAAALVCDTGDRAAFGVAGTVHRPHPEELRHSTKYTESLGELRRAWASRCLSRGRRSAQTVLEELRRAWAPLGPRVPFVWQAQYTEHPPELRRCVGASKQSVRGQLWRAWAPLGPRLPFDGRRSTQSSSRGCPQAQSQSLLGRSCGARRRRWPAAAFWQAQYSSQHN